MIVGISGYARAGKDTLGALMVEHLGFERRAFATKLYEAAEAFDPIVIWAPVARRLSDVVAAVGWSEAKNVEEVRRTLQRLGTEVGRETLDPDIWIRALDNTLERNIAGDIVPDKHYVVTDMRYQNEAGYIRGRHRGYTIRVNRPGVKPANSHSSESDLDNWPFDLVIDNDRSPEDMLARVKYYAERYWGILPVGRVEPVAPSHPSTENI